MYHAVEVSHSVAKIRRGGSTIRFRGDDWLVGLAMTLEIQITDVICLGSVRKGIDLYAIECGPMADAVEVGVTIKPVDDKLVGVATWGGRRVTCRLRTSSRNAVVARLGDKLGLKVHRVKRKGPGVYAVTYRELACAAVRAGYQGVEVKTFTRRGDLYIQAAAAGDQRITVKYDYDMSDSGNQRLAITQLMGQREMIVCAPARLGVYVYGVLL